MTIKPLKGGRTLHPDCQVFEYRFGEQTGMSIDIEECLNLGSFVESPEKWVKVCRSCGISLTEQPASKEAPSWCDVCWRAL